MLTEITGMRGFTPTINIRIEDVLVGKRARKDLGDLKPLQESIRHIGLLHPITITEENNQLVAGLRRLEACKALGYERIAARKVSIDNICRGEYDENEVRKNFTPSEREALASAIHDVLRSRGRRTDIGKPLHTEEQQQGVRAVISESGAETESTGAPPRSRKSRETASQMAGLNSWQTCHRVRCVKQQGIKMLIDAMDQEQISIDAAFLLSVLPAAEQADILEAGPKAVKDTVKRLRAEQRETTQRKTVVQSGIPALQYLLDQDKIALEEAHRIAKKDPAGQEKIVSELSHKRGGDYPEAAVDKPKRRRAQNAQCDSCWGLHFDETDTASVTPPKDAPADVQWFAIGVDTSQEEWKDLAITLLKRLMENY